MDTFSRPHPTRISGSFCSTMSRGLVVHSIAMYPYLANPTAYLANCLPCSGLLSSSLAPCTGFASRFIGEGKGTGDSLTRSLSAACHSFFPTTPRATLYGQTYTYIRTYMHIRRVRPRQSYLAVTSTRRAHDPPYPATPPYSTTHSACVTDRGCEESRYTTTWVKGHERKGGHTHGKGGRGRGTRGQ